MKGSIFDSAVLFVVAIVVLIPVIFLIKKYLISYIYTNLQQSPDYNTRKITSYLNNLRPGMNITVVYNLPGGKCHLEIWNTTVIYYGKGDEMSLRQRLLLPFNVKPARFDCGKNGKEIFMRFDGKTVEFEG